MFIGAGTLTNVLTVLVGGGLGLLVGHRLPERVRTTVTSALGLVTLLIAADAAAAVNSDALTSSTGRGAPTLIVLGSLAVGGIIGSFARLEDRLEDLGGFLQRRLGGSAARQVPLGDSAGPTTDGGPTDRGPDDGDRERFVQGFVIASLVFCVGPLTILGSLNEGLGRGAEQLLLKSTLDGFAALAFAAAFGVGVLASAISVLVVQGSLTGLGVLVGGLLPAAHLDAVGATGGLILVGVALRLLDLKQLPVADLLPALLVAPALTQLAVALA
ncbi:MULTISPECIES: DUF554 domain-containing protein [unclassified Aeromicrobium]|uniref:DUF554 domain-containing protein n=1 Tax=unclassified Aeromicrobium TaxID=2633570 RepID=UPI0006FD998A|nr:MULTISPECIES: DUF554 domain-containing protein [unclassified Aeromicrobium]KQP26353.1 hypothetical protein ASF38_12125 [Aeromicrobium sp. Leaf272]KQP76023.1 hypothetical protein ASF37_13860 [Aeromicrobium sp. Leaf289]